MLFEAVKLGADVITNSWGGGAPSAQIDAAIRQAMQKGRNGKGCIVLFAAGNYNTDVMYPATNEDVIAVGASTPCDTRKRSSNRPEELSFGVTPDPDSTSCVEEGWWGSNYGTGLDILSPGVIITTTDNVGENGIVKGDYNERFNGTSAACPNAAAVAALVLSTNSNLTWQEARYIVENSCFKIPNVKFNPNVPGQPNGTWSTQAGYGRLDAYLSVQRALNFTSSEDESNK